ncbi:hypothetical protein QTP70_025298, partial [Hemibagrus guttatus]
ELTGKLPCDFPLEVGEHPPILQHRSGKALNGTSKVENGFIHSLQPKDNLGQRRQVKTGFSVAHCQSTESDKNALLNKRTVHRGCHTEGLLRLPAESQEHGGDSRRQAVTLAELDRAIEGP